MTAQRHPSLSTHVLDVELGQPASGVPVSLFKLESGSPALQSTQRTNDDGRIADLLEGPLRPGSYRIVFDVAAYLRRRGVEEIFFSNVAIEFEIEDSERHYHVPLLISRYSCVSYRGS